MNSLHPACLRSMALAALVVVAACADDPGPVTPSETPATDGDWIISSQPMPEADARLSGGHAVYPLQLGNTWKYRAHVRIQSDTPGAPQAEEIIRTTKSEIIGSASVLGRCYTVEERAITEDIDPDEVFTQTIYYRQDRDGLYEADYAFDRPSRAPVGAAGGTLTRHLASLGYDQNWLDAAARIEDRVLPLRELSTTLARRSGVMEDELQRLDYPLHRGKHWVVMDDAFLMTATVEGRELLDLPVGRTAAWRVRLESSLYGPDDVVHLFYGRDGYLGWRVLVFQDVLDEDAVAVDRLRFTDEEFLTEATIDRRGELPCSETAQLKDAPAPESR